MGLSDVRDRTRGRLERTLLRAFADDVPVVGVHVLSYRDPSVPDIEVEVSTPDGSRSGWPVIESEAAAGRREAFESELRDVLLTAYADDQMAFPTERWTLSLVSELVPDWSVTATFLTAEEREEGTISRAGPEAGYDQV